MKKRWTEFFLVFLCVFLIAGGTPGATDDSSDYDAVKNPFADQINFNGLRGMLNFMKKSVIHGLSLT